MTRLTTDDKTWLSANFPSLTIIERPKYSIVEGDLHFRCVYNEEIIEDNYAIRLELPISPNSLPCLTETKGRLRHVLESHPEFGGDQAELHIYPSWKLCIGAPQDLRLNYLPNPRVELLFQRYILPYFYSQSYFEQYGRWPWLHLPHNSSGILTWYAENNSIPGAARETANTLRRLAKNNANAQHVIDRAMRRDSFSPNAKCICGSGRRLLQCHRQFIKLVLAIREST